jgi:hypothetical protein
MTHGRYGGIIRWEPPPEIKQIHNGRVGGRDEVNWRLVADQARERAETHPPEERWGIVREDVSSQQAAGFQARITGTKCTTYFQPVGAFEAVGRLCDDGVRRFYVRYVGDLPPAAAPDEDTGTV